MAIIRELRIESDDGGATLRGELALPDAVPPNAHSVKPASTGWESTGSEPTGMGALLIVPGGWFAERDGFMGDTYTELDLMYRRIARRVLAKNFAVVRYDNRGVSGNEWTLGISRDSDDWEGDHRRYLSTCIDAKVRATVTPESLMADAATFYRTIARHPQVDSSKVVIFAHSEGGLHVARLIASQTVAPRGVVLAGTITRSPAESLKWQCIDRYVAEIMSWDRGKNGVVDGQDIAAGYLGSVFPEVGLEASELQPDGQSWTQSQLREHFTRRYEQEKKQTMAIPDTDPFPPPSDGAAPFVAAAHRWMKQWYDDDRTVLGHLRTYPGQIAFHFGEIDRQLSVPDEISHIRQMSSWMASVPRVTIHRQRGHAFCTDKPVVGPMDADAEDRLVDEIVGMLQSDQ